MSAREALEARLVRELGLSLDRGGTRRSLDRFLEARWRELDLPRLDPLLERLLDGDPEELERLVQAVTVPHSWFYRDADQWRTIEGWMRAHGSSRPLDVWVPACATGEDVYTLALLGLEIETRLRVLGTDVHGEALATARRGRYGAWAVRDLPLDAKARLTSTAGGTFEVPEEARAMVRWSRHSLMEAPLPSPSGQGWDLVLCRNVLFYFAQATAADVVARLAGALSPRGRLVLGASDMLHSTPPGYQATRVAERTVIERCEGSPKPARRIHTAPPPAPSRPQHERAHAPRSRPSAERTKISSHPPAGGPLDPVARLARGIASLSRGDLPSAIAELRAALFLRPGLWPAAVYLGLAHERAGHRVEAARCFARAASSGTPDTELDALPEELRAFCDELAALAQTKSRKKIA